MLLADKRELQNTCVKAWAGLRPRPALLHHLLPLPSTHVSMTHPRPSVSRLKLSLIQIEEKELNFYTNNCMTVGTQAALLAGFGFTGIIEVNLMKVKDDSGETVDITAFKILWFSATVIAMILEISSLIKAMQLSILGPGLALRGPEGSMTRALAVMRVEYKKVHNLFYAGLGFFLISVTLCERLA